MAIALEILVWHKLVESICNEQTMHPVQYTKYNGVSQHKILCIGSNGVYQGKLDTILCMHIHLNISIEISYLSFLYITLCSL